MQFFIEINFSVDIQYHCYLTIDFKWNVLIVSISSIVSI